MRARVLFCLAACGGSSSLGRHLEAGPVPRARTTHRAGTYTTTCSHSSQLKSVEQILGVPVLATVSSANDFSDLFQPGQFP